MTEHAVARAEALLDAGRAERAAALLGGHLAQRPDDAQALALLARCRRRTGDVAGALEAVDAALAANPTHIQAWVIRANVLAQESRWAEAEAAARRAVALIPQHWAGHHTLGATLIASNDKSRRIEAYQAALRAVELDPERSANHFLIGVAAHRCGDTRTAESAYRAALRLDPEDATARYNLSVLHLRGSWLRPRRWATAAEGFADAAALDATDGAAVRNLEVMAWRMMGGAGLVAVAGCMIAVSGTAEARDGGPLLPAVPVAGGLLLALWTLWVWRSRVRVPPRLRSRMLRVVWHCPPVRSLGCAVALLTGYELAAVVLPRADQTAMAMVGAALIWGVIIVSLVSSRALRKRQKSRTA